ncbi:hypothetical protein C8A01DRAFT_35335 [Parachaetomium inaequale]|uniref:Uncharacterized protein n=1 Tax=Parachaetomium inaequale TaxID=2588326 RepID=A0AAN6PK92_9PEZI|nr:hypothetical protein C8A01DRAFT_35335 [Parachaetomium inaequale]
MLQAGLPSRLVDKGDPLGQFSSTAGHALVEYLYSGYYKLLRAGPVDPSLNVKLWELKAHLEICALAQTVGLAGLDDLSGKEVQDVACDLDILTVFGAIDAAHPIPAGNGTWFPRWIRSYLEQAFEGPRKRASLVGFLFECMMEAYAGKLEPLAAQNGAAAQPETPITDSHVSEICPGRVERADEGGDECGDEGADEAHGGDLGGPAATYIENIRKFFKSLPRSPRRQDQVESEIASQVAPGTDPGSGLEEWSVVQEAPELELAPELVLGREQEPPPAVDKDEPTAWDSVEVLAGSKMSNKGKEKLKEQSVMIDEPARVLEPEPAVIESSSNPGPSSWCVHAMAPPAWWTTMRYTEREPEPLVSEPGYVSSLTRQDDGAYSWTLPGDDPFVMVEKVKDKGKQRG